MGNLTLVYAREPSSTSLATGAKGSVLHLLIVRELNSLSCHAFHSLAHAQASVANHIDKPLPASSRIDRASEARRGWMSERLKESVLKTELEVSLSLSSAPLGFGLERGICSSN
ncbi:hypothetical protein BDE02_07G060300 [Populus trichocarpa]|nr:hypothetical protein BDE02_07G055700 [Populus trichocarpa]KAI5582050.1 hypothetical protein BDE02_07G060300 [Populus trichocarpa]